MINTIKLTTFALLFGLIINVFATGEPIIKLGDEVVFSLGSGPKPKNVNTVRSSIEYPEVFRNNGIGGTVLVKIQLDENGEYMQHTVVSSPYQVLTDLIESKVKMLKFEPATQGGKPVKSWVVVPFHFRAN